MPDRPYLFSELTNSICATCLRKVEAKIIFENDRVFMVKRCPTHGFQKVLVSTDIEYYKLTRQTVKPGQMPLRFHTPIKYGCPYDCGLCPDHEQHSCLTLLEITDSCNLKCPVCYADSGPHRPNHRSMQQIEFMLDAIVKSEGHPDVVQVSGGEPTIHPEFFEVLDACKARPIKHLMVNTNGLRIANEPGFAERLASYMPGFELYLQFDSFEREALMELRGADLRSIREAALEKLNALNLSTTLVVTLKKGLNDHEIGKIIDFALTQRCVRGVTFQPIQDAGRVEDFDPATDRLTLGEVRQMILAQTNVFKPHDIVPVPCHPDCLAMAYALKVGDAITALTGLVDPQILLHGEGNTIMYEQSPQLRKLLFDAFSTAASPSGAATTLAQLLCCLPLAPISSNIVYDNIFRIIINQFLDRHYFDVRSVKKTCVHIAHPDGRIIPFDTYNMFYRNGRERILDRLREGRFDEVDDLVPMTVGGRIA